MTYLEVWIGQVEEVLPQLARIELPLVDNGLGGQGASIESPPVLQSRHFVGQGLPQKEDFALKSIVLQLIICALHKDLKEASIWIIMITDDQSSVVKFYLKHVRFTIRGHLSKARNVARHHPPAHDLEVKVFGGGLKSRFGVFPQSVIFIQK